MLLPQLRASSVTDFTGCLTTDGYHVPAALRMFRAFQYYCATSVYDDDRASASIAAAAAAATTTTTTTTPDYQDYYCCFCCYKYNYC